MNNKKELIKKILIQQQTINIIFEIIKKQKSENFNNIEDFKKLLAKIFFILAKKLNEIKKEI